MQVFDGKSGSELAKLCGTLSPIPYYIRSRSNVIRIVFKTDVDATSRGWVIYWTGEFIVHYVEAILI